jgi:MoxR-like ATPase
MNIQNRLHTILDIISQDMHEREEVLRVALLGALCGQNSFLYGPPGTGKSLIARRISQVFKSTEYFETLMHSFMQPSEVFGPVSISALKNDQYLHQVDGYLPSAGFAFLDEIWKAHPSILNTLLTIINEGVFHNGNQAIHVPLKGVISASNETPTENQGLDALYDRFSLRLIVPPIQNNSNFESLINSSTNTAEVSIPEQYVITDEEWTQWQTEIEQVELSRETLNMIFLIRYQLNERGEELQVYASDRRWKKAASLLKASAFFSGRKTTNVADGLLLQHALWTNEKNQKDIALIVKTAAKECGLDIGADLAQLAQSKDQLADQISIKERQPAQQLKVYEFKDGQYYYKGQHPLTVMSSTSNTAGGLFASAWRVSHQPNNSKKQDIYVRVNEYNTQQVNHVYDQSGQPIEGYHVQFSKDGKCLLKSEFTRLTEQFGLDPEEIEFKPVIETNKPKGSKGSPKKAAQLLQETQQLKAAYQTALHKHQVKFEQIRPELNSLFTSEGQSKPILKGIEKQQRNLKVHIKDLERLERECV